jgi:ribosome-binding factor A
MYNTQTHNRKQAILQKEIYRLLRTYVINGFNDQQLLNFNITYVISSRDFRHIFVLYLNDFPIDDNKNIELGKYFRGIIASNLSRLRYIPTITLVYDRETEMQLKISKLKFT